MKEHKIIRQTIKVPGGIRAMSWQDDEIIDWALGFAYHFDRSITSQDGQYAFVYHNRGTKGVLLKNGKFLREINRTYYHAETYEYPAAFYTSPGGLTYLIHCPREYCRLDFEEVETGKIVTDVPERDPVDIFHSRLQVSPDSKFLMVRGWCWHPIDVIHMYDINACLQDPKLLDIYENEVYQSDGPSENSIGAFINNDHILIGALKNEDDDDETNFPKNHLAVWDFKKKLITDRVKVCGIVGNIVGVYDNMAWDFYQYPKIIDLRTGDIVDKLEELATGTQTSSIIRHLHQVPEIIFNRKLNKVAVKTSSFSGDHNFYDQIEILSLK